MDKKVVLISNFTDADHEFSCIRITNTNVCHGCWNKAEYRFDAGDWEWCPLEPRKGLEYLLRALPLVLKAVPYARLVIVGTGYLEQRYRKMVPRGLTPRVTFTGYVPPEHLPGYYAACDVYCSPAIGNESFGIVLLEAMAAGRPVVATDIPGYRSVIRPGVNEAFPPGDVGSLARVLVRLIQDPARRAELARRGRARALEFAWPRVTDRIEAVYREALERRATVTSAA